jgi:hypothetical protein
MTFPVYAFDFGAHSLSVQAGSSSYSCSSPIGISGTATGNNILRRHVKITITDVSTGVAVAHGSAKVSGGAYSTTIIFTNQSMQEGYFTVTATWYGQVAHGDGSFYWAC